MVEPPEYVTVKDDIRTCAVLEIVTLSALPVHVPFVPLNEYVPTSAEAFPGPYLDVPLAVQVNSIFVILPVEQLKVPD